MLNRLPPTTNPPRSRDGVFIGGLWVSDEHEGIFENRLSSVFCF